MTDPCPHGLTRPCRLCQAVAELARIKARGREEWSAKREAKPAPAAWREVAVQEMGEAILRARPSRPRRRVLTADEKERRAETRKATTRRKAIERKGVRDARRLTVLEPLSQRRAAVTERVAAYREKLGGPRTIDPWTQEQTATPPNQPPAPEPDTGEPIAVILFRELERLGEAHPGFVHREELGDPPGVQLSADLGNFLDFRRRREARRLQADGANPAWIAGWLGIPVAEAERLLGGGA
jgi:hypothetical protein